MRLKTKKYFSLKKNNDFKRLFNRGKKVFSPALTMLYKSSHFMQMGICVSKKHGNSVERNRIKRLIREAFRNECGNINGRYCFIFIPKMAINYSYATFNSNIRSMLQKEGLLNEQRDKN